MSCCLVIALVFAEFWTLQRIVRAKITEGPQVRTIIVFFLVLFFVCVCFLVSCFVFLCVFCVLFLLLV